MATFPPSPNIEPSSATSSSVALHEFLSHCLVTDSLAARQRKLLWPMTGTLQDWNQQIRNAPTLDFINYTLRGIGQVIFINNPISGFLILLALFIQSPWVGWLGLLGILTSTVTALVLKLDRETICNGIFGYNGLLIGAALGTFSNPELGAGYWGWAIATLVFSALSTVMMKTLGVWWAKTVNTPPLTLPFCILTVVCLALAQMIPSLGLALDGPSGESSIALDGLRLAAALPIGVGQVFLAGKLLSGLLILLAVALCSPLGALVALFGATLGILAGLIFGITPTTLYAGLWGYNSVLCILAIGGIFYAPNTRSIFIGAIAAFLSALFGGLLTKLFSTLSLPALTFSFCMVTILCFVALKQSIPSLVPVALHTITSPEEHWQRYRAAKEVITNFRQQLGRSITGQRQFYLFDHASDAMKGDLRYLFSRIDTDQNGELSISELATHWQTEGLVFSDEELNNLFTAMDLKQSGVIDFEEFGELMLRHQRLMANYTEFVTYFLPIDANGDDAISLDEMNIAMASVGEPPFSQEEEAHLVQQSGYYPLTWNRFIETILIT